MDPGDRDPLYEAVARVLEARPQEAATWLLQRSLSRRTEVVEAVPIRSRPERHLYAIEGGPPPAPSPDRIVEQAVKDVLIDGLAREAAETGVELRRVDLDWEALRHETLRRGGADVQLLARLRNRKNGAVEPMLVAIPIAGPAEEGRGMPDEVCARISWQFEAWRRIVQPLLPTGASQSPSFFFTPLYIHPGTGLRDPEEIADVYIPRSGDVPGLLGNLLDLASSSEKERRRTRRSNEKRLARRKKLDAARRRAARRRQRLMGDALITEEELAEMFVDVDVERERCSLFVGWHSIRIWEEPFEKLLEQLPTGCLGLALCGYAPPEVSRQQMLERCAWTLRRRLEGPPQELSEVAGLIQQVAACWLDPEEIDALLRPYRLG